MRERVRRSRKDFEDDHGENDRTDHRERRKEISPEKLKPMVLDYLDKRFGLGEDVFSGYGFYLASKGRVYLGPKRTIDKPRVVTVGLLIARVTDTVKPTTNLLQAFGPLVKKNIVTLDREPAVRFCKGEDLMFKEQPPGAIGDGYILLTYENNPLGCGHLKGKIMKNMLPKAKRLDIKNL
jgi:NOL1/NOP2/fmu family ribosome biogenesis protein